MYTIHIVDDRLTVRQVYLVSGIYRLMNRCNDSMKFSWWMGNEDNRAL